MQALFNQPPRKAIEYLENKKVMPSQDWWQVQGNAHNKAFVIAQMTRMDLLEDIRQSLIDAQKNGWDLKKWSEVVEPKMKARGWWGKQDIMTEGGQRTVQLGNPYRLKTIYQTNMSQAYEAGRQAVMWDDNPLFPYVQYSAILDNRTRPQHRALHGVVMRKNDPAWAAIAPKNGYNCRCTVIELMQADVDAVGAKVRNSEGYFSIEEVDVSHGGIAQVAKLDFPDRPSFRTDAGWVGRPNAMPIKQLMDKAVTAQPRLSSKIIEQTFKNKSVADQYHHEVKQWVQRFDASKLRNDIQPVGSLSTATLDALKRSKNIDLKSSMLGISDQQTLSSLDQDLKKWLGDIVQNLDTYTIFWDEVTSKPFLFLPNLETGGLYRFDLLIDQQTNINVLGMLVEMTAEEFRSSEHYQFMSKKMVD